MACLLSTAKPARSQEYIVLQIILNSEGKGERFCLLSSEKKLWLRRADLTEMGLIDNLGEEIQFNREVYTLIGSVPDLEYIINEDKVSLEITAAPHLFRKQYIDARYRESDRMQHTGTGSAFFNYAGTYIDEYGESSFDISGELGISLNDYFGRSTFTYQKTNYEDSAIRLETSLTINDRENLVTTTFGDVPAFSGILGTGTLLGGFNVSKNFSIDPYYIRFPSLDLTGTLDTPSDVEVYMDGLLVKRERLSPGEFVFHDIPSTVGLGSAEVIIHDAYGRERIITTPYYYSDGLLKKGLHEYSYSVGFIREEYGEKSFSYGKAAFLGFHNYGLRNNFTIGYSAEASDNVINAGPRVSFLVSKAGIVNAALAVSSARGEKGLSGFLSYAFQSRYVNARMSVRSDSAEYSNLFLEPSDDRAKVQFDTAVGFGLKKAGSVTVAYSMSDMYREGETSRTSISYNRALTTQSTLFITASETIDNDTVYEILAGLHVYFGRDISANFSYRGSKDVDDKSVRVQKSLPVGTGYGFRTEFENTRHGNNYGGSLQYQNDYGIYEVGYSDRMGREKSRVSVSGGIGYIDTSIFLSRPIIDSFAKVKVGELEGVRTYYYGNEVGKTDNSGEIIVPNVHSFYENKIDIEVGDIPLNYSIPSNSTSFSPPFRSGSLIHFDVKKVQGISGSLFYRDNGEEFPVESAVIHIKTGREAVRGLVGTEGEFYVENVIPGNHPAQVRIGEKRCLFTIHIPDSDEMFLDLGKNTCEVPE